MSWWEPAWQTFRTGGPVMWPLLAVSVWLWTAILAKLRWLWRVRRERLRAEQAQAWLRDGAPPQGVVPGQRGRALGDFVARRTGRPELDLRLWRAAVLASRAWLPRQLALIAALAAAAPLLGLLGTVTGMIGTFQAIQEHGTGNAQALAAGISEALITTQAGLMVAIPGLLAGHYLRRQVRKESQRLTEFQQMVEVWLGCKEERQCSL